MQEHWQVWGTIPMHIQPGRNWTAVSALSKEIHSVLKLCLIYGINNSSGQHNRWIKCQNGTFSTKIQAPQMKIKAPPPATSGNRAGIRRALIRTQRGEKVTSTPIQPYQPAQDMSWPMSPQSRPVHPSLSQCIPVQPYQPSYDISWPMSPQSTSVHPSPPQYTPVQPSPPQYNPVHPITTLPTYSWHELTNVSTAHNAHSSSPLKTQVTPCRVNISLLTRDWYNLQSTIVRMCGLYAVFGWMWLCWCWGIH